MAEHGNKVRFLDRKHETRRVKEAFRSGNSLMITGPADVGKTALIRHVLAGLPSEARHQSLYLAGFKNLHDLLSKLLEQLYQAGDPALRRQLRTERVSRAGFEAWLKASPSPRLKGTLYRTVEHGGYRVILDQIPSVSQPIAKVLKELFWTRNTPVCLLVRNQGKQEIEEISRLFFWERRQHLALGPLPAAVAGEMLEQCIARFRLSNLDLDGFREEILDLSGGVPGAIVKMCRLAADQRYQYGRRIKTRLVHIDYLTGRSLPTSTMETGDRQFPNPSES